MKTPDELPSTERSILINEALLVFAAITPVEARRFWMWLNGQTYHDMAVKELTGSNVSREELDSKENSIEKQFTCAVDGTITKFRIVLERYLKMKSLSIQNIL